MLLFVVGCAQQSEDTQIANPASVFCEEQGGKLEIVNDPAGQQGCEARHGQAAHARWEARRAARLSGLKEKLKLAPEQEAAWNTYVSATQPRMLPAGGDRQVMRGEFEKLNTPQRLDRMLAMSEARRARMLERSQAIKAFYAQLNPAQQSVFDADAMFDPLRGHGHHRFQS